MKLRGGEILLGVAASALIAVLFLNWFQTGETGSSGWTALSVGVLIVVGATVALAALLIVCVQRGDLIALSVALSVVSTTMAIAATIAVIIDVISATGGETDARWPAVAGILFVALMILGSWRSMGDERLDAPDSAYTPPEPRSIPEA